MFRRNGIFVLLYVIANLWDTTAMTIELDHRGIGVLGGNETELICSFMAEATEEVISLQILVDNGTSSFEAIALFRPNGSANVTDTGAYLRGRVELINSIEQAGLITMRFTVLICSDEKNYKCRIWYFVEFNQLMMETEAKNITVKASPLKPDTVFQSNSTQLIEEGTHVTFFCNGNLGKPPSYFVWQKFRKNNHTPINYDNVTTVPTEVTESCTYNGTSNITIRLTAEDNEAIMRCVVQSMTALYQDSEPVNVFYKVRKPSISKHPNHEFYVVGSGDIQLACDADGNPQSNYTWYKGDNMDQSLSSNSSLIIDTMNINNSGTYACHAVNSLSGNRYYTNESADIFIVYNIPDSSTSKIETAVKDKKVYERFDFVVVVSVLAVTLSLIVIITFSCLVRKNIFPQYKSKTVDSNYISGIERYHGEISREMNLTGHYSLAMLPSEERKADLSNNTNDASECKKKVAYNGATKNKNAKSITKNPSAHYSLAEPQYTTTHTDFRHNTDCTSKCQKNVVHSETIENAKHAATRLLVEQIPEYATVTKISKSERTHTNILCKENSGFQIEEDIYADSTGIYDTLGNSRHKPNANCEKFDRIPKRSSKSGHSVSIKRIPEYATVTKLPKLGNKHSDVLYKENSGLQINDDNSEDNTGQYDTLCNSRQTTNANCEMYDHIPKRGSPESADDKTKLADGNDRESTSEINGKEYINKPSVNQGDTSNPKSL